MKQSKRALRSMRQELIRTGNQKIQVALTSAETAQFPHIRNSAQNQKSTFSSRSREAHSRA